MSSITLTVISVVASMVSYILVDYAAKFIFKKKKIETANFNMRLKQLTNNLLNASKEVDNVLNELSSVTENREISVRKIELQLDKLGQKEIELKNKIETLEKIPLPVAEHFARLLESGEKRSKKRDYFLFGAGVIVTTVISIILNFWK